MLDQKVLVLKLGSVDRLTPCSVKPLKVAALQHELGDDPVEDCALVGEALLVLSRGNCSKVGSGSGNNLRYENIRENDFWRMNLIEEFHVDNTIILIVSSHSELGPDTKR